MFQQLRLVFITIPKGTKIPQEVKDLENEIRSRQGIRFHQFFSNPKPSKELNDYFNAAAQGHPIPYPFESYQMLKMYPADARSLCECYRKHGINCDVYIPSEI